MATLWPSHLLNCREDDQLELEAAPLVSKVEVPSEGAQLAERLEVEEARVRLESDLIENGPRARLSKGRVRRLGLEAPVVACEQDNVGRDGGRDGERVVRRRDRVVQELVEAAEAASGRRLARLALASRAAHRLHRLDPPGDEGGNWGEEEG